MKKGKQITFDILRWIASALYMLTFYVLGLVLYYLSKLVRVAGFYLILAPTSARNELSGFWQVYKAIGDVFPKK